MRHKRVFVGLSGGVDSSVAAVRLIRAGYDVVGVFIKVWQPDFIRCNWEAERLDAMRVAAHLHIPFLTFDAEAAYKQHVADYMITEYRLGRTPNPDVMCNEHVKFGVFYDWARAHGADFVATGHYAQRFERDGVHVLVAGVDSRKDQSYFLARIDPAILPHILFPVGKSTKDVIRAEAERAGLPTSTKADSQGLCFLGHVDIPDFLSHFIELDPGDVLDREGSVIGTHRGALLYTLGQRHGFTIRTKRKDAQIHYVIARDIHENTITVDTTPPTIPDGGAVRIFDVISFGHGIEEHMDVVFRYHGPRIPVTVTHTEGGNAILTPQTPHKDLPAAGQIAVLYKGDECRGSGIINDYELYAHHES